MTAPARPLDQLGTLADATRSRILLLLEGSELTVGELCTCLQLPQSTVSRHLKILSDEKWVSGRDAGAARYYALMPSRLDRFSRRLWNVVREQARSTSAARQDAHRKDSVLAARHDSVRAFFKGGASTWDGLRAQLTGRRTDLLALLDLFDVRWTVGDLGCGTGHVSLALAPVVRRVIAVDESPHMLSAARKRLAAFDNVELRPGSLESLPIEDGVLDIALLFMVTQFVLEPVKVLREVKRALSPAGRLLITDLTAFGGEDMALSGGHAWQGFTEEQLRNWVSDAGLTVSRYRVLPAEPSAKGPAMFSLVATKQ